MELTITPDLRGYEAPNPIDPEYRQPIKNLACPVDGHYCEQPNCDNCNYEAQL